jgi:hypothetical protein
MRILALAALLAAGCSGSTRKAAAPAAAGPLDPALEACARGDLDAAEALVRSNRDLESIHLRARLLMLRNRNREAIELLTPLLQGKPKGYEETVRQLRVLPDLAEAYVRQDDFQNAAKAYALMGEAILSKKCESLARSVAYSSNLGSEELTVDFFATDPLPIVAGTVNGQRILFVVDTLLDEIVIDRDFARRAGLLTLGVRGVGNVDEATVQEVGVGRLTVKNVPVHLGDAAQVGSLRPDGAIGLQFLMHYDFTLDYRRSRLTLRKAGGSIAGVPVFFAGDRYLLLEGKVNGKDKTFVGLGTGLKGITLAASDYFELGQGAEILEFSAGPLKLVKPALDSKSFPAGLDGSFGIPVGFVLGHAALRGRVLRLEPRSMRLLIE